MRKSEHAWIVGVMVVWLSVFVLAMTLVFKMVTKWLHT